MNKIFTMLVHVSYEDLNVLKNYMSDAIIFFKHDKQVKHLINNKIMASLPGNQEINKEKDRKKFQRKNKSCEMFSLPLKRLVPFNFLLYLIILGGYLALLSFSNIFNSNLSNKALLKDKISQQPYIDFGESLTYLYDSIAANRLNFSYYNNGQQFLLDYFQNMSDSQKFTILKNPIPDDYFNLLFSLYEQEDMCQTLYNGANINYPNFFGENYFEVDELDETSCSNLLDKVLTEGLIN
jgi:hypothetical protein